MHQCNVLKPCLQMASTCLLVAALYLTMSGLCITGTYGCTPVRNVDARSPDGTVAAQMYAFPPCLPAEGTTSCASFDVRKVVINFANKTTYNPAVVIRSCMFLNWSLTEDSFCWNQTDQTIRVTPLLEQLDYILGSQFLYTINVYAAVGMIRCYLHLKIDWFITTPSTPKRTTTPLTANTTSSITRNPTTREHSTPWPQIDVKIHPDNITEIQTALDDGSNKARLQCSCTLNSKNLRRVKFFWLKDGLSLERLNATSFSISNSTEVDANGTMMIRFYLSIDIRKTVVQGYYRCAGLVDGKKIVLGNETLVWLKDVASMRLKIRTTSVAHQKLENRSSLTLDEFQSIFNIKLEKDLKKKKLKKDNFDLYVKHQLSNPKRNSSEILFDVFYREVDDSEKLRICKVISNDQGNEFNLTSLDCCFASTTGVNTSRGAIDWPITLHGIQAEVKCPFSKKADKQRAYRTCITDFINGPSWAGPDNADCQKASETTKKLKKLSEEKIDKTNRKEAMKSLRRLTKDARNLTNQLDFEFSTEIMEKVLNVQDKQNELLGDILGTTSDLMNGNESLIISSQETSNTSTRLLKLLEKLSDEVEVNATLSQQQENVAIGITVFSNADISNGVKIHGIINDTNNFPALEFSNTDNFKRERTAYVFLSPASLGKINKNIPLKRQKLTSFLFNKPVLFESVSENGTFAKKKSIINGKILSLMINGRRVQDLTEEEEIQNYFKPNLTDQLERTSCVYWNFKAKGGKGDWSTKGCRKEGMKNGMFLCKCNHMTNFAILLDVSQRRLSSSETKALSFVSYIGCAISLLSLIITIATFASFRKLRQSRPNKILLCLSSSLVMTMIIFLGGGLSARFPAACQIVAVLLHYFVLSSFCWMLVEAFNIYQSFIVVFQKGTSRFMLKANLFSWGVPFLVVLITTILSELRDYRKAGSDNLICIVGGLPFYIAYLSPISLVLLGNFIVLIITMFSLGRRSSYGTNTSLDVKAKTRIAIIFSVLLGCTWIFGLVAVEDLKFTFQLLFCIFNSLQGFFIFLFFCLRNEDVRSEWKRILCACDCRKRRDKIRSKKFESESRNQTLQLDNWKSESVKTLTS